LKSRQKRLMNPGLLLSAGFQADAGPGS